MDDLQRIQFILNNPPPALKPIQESITKIFGENKLLPVQLEALGIITRLRKAFISAGVGHGKTLISLLAPLVSRSSRSLLFIPANLVEQLTLVEIPKYEKLLNVKFDWCCIQGKTQHQRLKLMNKHRITIFPYSFLSTEDTVDLLEASAADLIIADECHHLKNEKTPKTKRFLKYVDANKPDLVFLGATFLKKNLFDYWHLISRCLGSMSPLPLEYQTTLEVQNAIRWDSTMKYEYSRFLSKVEPSLCKGNYLVDVEDSRTFVRKVFDTTMGTIRTSDQSVDCSITVDLLRIEMDDSTKEDISNLQKTWQTPDGDEIEEALVFYGHMSQILSGFYYKLYWPKGTPQWCIDANELHNELKKEIRQFISARHREKLDTPKLVRNSLELKNKETKRIQQYYDAYFEFLDGRVPTDRKQKTNPLSTYRMKYAKKWADRKKHGIIWYKWDCLGKMLLKEIPGSHIFDPVNPQKPGIVLCSFAHAEGKNLQHQSNNLLYNSPSNAAQFEQLMGRTHRQGQTEDTVYFDIFLANKFEENQLKSVIRQARYLSSMVSKQKLLLADWADTSLLTE